MTVSSKRFHLQQCTRMLHRDIDDALGPVRTKRDYIRYLDGTVRFRKIVEPALKRAVYPDFFGDWRPSILSRELNRDARHFGLDRSDVNAWYSIPDGNSALLGALYVLEGSSLGARLILRSAEALGIGKDSGASHLHAQVARNNSWTDFQNILESCNQYDEDVAARSACELFQVAKTSFEVSPLHA